MVQAFDPLKNVVIEASSTESERQAGQRWTYPGAARFVIRWGTMCNSSHRMSKPTISNLGAM